MTGAARQGHRLTAECAGTLQPFYRVTVELDEGGVRAASCTCPYELDGYCKHIVAVLLTYLHRPNEFAEQQPLEELLADLDRDELFALVQNLLQRQPELYDLVDAQITAPTPSQKKGRAKKVDVALFRRRVQNVLHSLDGASAYDAYGGMRGLADGLREVVASVQKFLDAGDAENARAILLTLVAEFTHNRPFEYLDDSNGELGAFMDEVGVPLAEAILSENLSPVERGRVAARLQEWKRELADFGCEGNLDVAIEAATYGWDESPEPRGAHRIPSARRVYIEDDYGSDDEEWDEDELGDEGVPNPDSPSLRGPIDLVEAKLNVLARQGRTDEFLVLSKKEGRHLRHALQLCALGRVADAAKYASKHLTEAAEALTLAQTLRDGGHIAEALAVGERGLRLDPPRFPLASWLAPLEQAQGRAPQALAAWLAAFAEEASLELYRVIKELGAAKWVKLEPRLLKLAAKSWNKSPFAEILLYEERWDEAIQLAERRAVAGGPVAALVADRVIPHRPEWVIAVSRKEADRLISETQSKLYPVAAEWMARAKRAYAHLHREREWRAYLQSVK